jgi:septum formation protein
MQKVLYLASSSKGRHELLTTAGFTVITLKQTYDEASCEWNIPPEQLVSRIALHKMEHVILPSDTVGEIFVVTADTLCTDLNGAIFGKPVNKENALAMIKALRNGSFISTAFCLDRKQNKEGSWVLVDRIERVVTGYCSFELPDEFIEEYMKRTNWLDLAGSLSIEGYGSLFLKKVIGSYSGIIGLPLCELREALSQLGFF